MVDKPAVGALDPALERVGAEHGAGAQLPEHPRRAKRAGKRVRVGELREECEGILQSFTAALRVDPVTSRAHSMPQAQLEDHAVTLIADLQLVKGA